MFLNTSLSRGTDKYIHKTEDDSCRPNMVTFYQYQFLVWCYLLSYYSATLPGRRKLNYSKDILVFVFLYYFLERYNCCLSRKHWFIEKFFFSYRQCLCCFKEYKHLEIFNQVVCALINLVIAQVQVLRDQLCKHCTTINIDSTWQDESNQAEEPLNIERECNEGSTERQKSIEKKSNSTRICNLTEEESSKSSDPFSLWNTDEKEKLLLCVAKIFQIQFPLYTAYKHNTHPTIEVCKNRYCEF